MQSVKAELRKKMLEKMSQLDDEYIKEADKKIKENVIKLEDYQKAKMIFTFVNMNNEINTKAIITDAIKNGKRICVPKVDTSKKGIMHAYEIQSLDDLVSGHFGTEEPKEDALKISPSQIDFAIIPCVAADRKGYRLGYGGGFYDRYLHDRKYKTAVLCREKGLIENAPKEEHDLQLDYLITENETIHTK